MVVRIRRIRNGLEASAGFHAAIPTDKYAGLTTIELTDALTADQLQGLMLAANAAISNRLTGADLNHLVHPQ